MPDTYATFNSRRFLQAAKEAGHTTNTAIAKHLGVSESQVSRCATGMYDPSFDTLARIRDAYGVELGDLVTYMSDWRITRPAGRDTTDDAKLTPSPMEAAA